MDIDVKEVLSYIRNADEDKAEQMFHTVMSHMKAQTLGAVVEQMHTAEGEEEQHAHLVAMAMACEQGTGATVKQMAELLGKELPEEEEVADNIIPFRGKADGYLH
jgi:hypothetical protein